MREFCNYVLPNDLLVERYLNWNVTSGSFRLFTFANLEDVIALSGASLPILLGYVLVKYATRLT